MWRWLKEQWRLFRQDRPGERFRNLYVRRERSSHARLKKFVFLGGGLVAIAVGIVTYPIPVVPSDFVILFGIASVAQASRGGARALDWLELRLQPVFRVAYRVWKPLPRWAKTTLIILWSALLAWGGFALYRHLAG